MDRRDRDVKGIRESTFRQEVLSHDGPSQCRRIRSDLNDLNALEGNETLFCRFAVTAAGFFANEPRSHQLEAGAVA